MPSELTAAPKNRYEATRALLQSDEAYGTTLLVLALHLWPECLHDPDEPNRGPWHPETFRTMLEDEFGIEVPQGTLDRLLAAVAVLTTDQFWTDTAKFIELANILAGSPATPGVFDPADSVECAWAITEALLIDPPDGDGPFSDDVRAYLTFVLKDEGYVTPPDVLRIALDGDFSSQVTYAFADDPELFQGIHAVQQGKAAEVEDIVRGGLVELVGQLKVLPLPDGSTAELEEQITQLTGGA